MSQDIFRSVLSTRGQQMAVARKLKLGRKSFECARRNADAGSDPAPCARRGAAR